MALQPFGQNVPSRPVQEDQPEYSWTETQMVVSEATFYPELMEGGKVSYSIRLELVAEPESSSNTRNRTVMQLAFGLEEKDTTTFTRMLGRKVYLNQQRSTVSLERDQLANQLEQAREYIASLERKVEYLNDSLHHYVQESRNSPF